MEYTEKLRLNLPQRGDTPDPADIEVLNENFEKLDAAIPVSDIKPTPADFPTPSGTNEGEQIIDGQGRVWTNNKLEDAKPTEYGYDTLSYTEGLDADKPAEGFYHATDTDKWYKDGEEITVDTTHTELPEASEDTVGVYYLIGTTLSLGKKTEHPAKYAWICGQIKYYISDTDIEISDMVDGIVYERLVEVGGGSTDFATINIHFPANDLFPTVTTASGTIHTAPDKSGLWIYKAGRAGIYTVTYGAQTQTVEITTEGQVEDVTIVMQTNNFLKIYDYGNEMMEVTSGITLYQSGTDVMYKTNETVDFSSYKYASLRYNTSVDDDVPFCGILGILAPFSPYNNLWVVDISSVPDKNTNVYGYLVHYTTASTSSVTMKKNSTYLYGRARHIDSSSGRSWYAGCNMYSICLYKEDDISILSDYGSTTEEILNNNGALFNDREALTKMVTSLTGSFMAMALTNTAFKTAYNASANRDIITDNEVWGDFIKLIV